MPHFFINTENINNEIIEISDKENYNHIARSLRARVGEILLLIDEKQIQYETKIIEITSSKIITKITNSYKSKRFLDFDLYLGQVPLRSDAQNFIIEKATELGVSRIYPIYTDNCALNKSAIEKKIPKWQKIMYESSKQCERANIPTICNLTTLEDVVKLEKFDKILIFCERIATKIIRDTLPIKKNDKILVIIGPEGGFSQEEFEWIKSVSKVAESKVEMLTLGNLILRAETAVIVALGNIIYEYSNSN